MRGLNDCIKENKNKNEVISEKEIIEKIKTYLDIENDGFSGHLEYETVQGLLDLYNKQKEKIQSLTNQLDFIGEQNKYIDRLEYEIKKKDAYIEELENWTKEHPSVISMPEEIREEAEKLGHFADLVTIEEKEYISKDKIREKIKEIKDRRLVEGECELALHGFIREGKIDILKELLEEK